MIYGLILILALLIGWLFRSVDKLMDKVLEAQESVINMSKAVNELQDYVIRYSNEMVLLRQTVIEMTKENEKELKKEKTAKKTTTKKKTTKKDAA